jgi:hypothetical protein
MSVKVSARVMPVLDAPEGDLPFRRVEFEGLTATAYVEENGNFSRIAWSMRAKGVKSPAPHATPRTDKAVA